jgi:hypothetical protein
MKIGARAGNDNELGKRCVCRCSACGRVMTFGAAVFASGSVACNCAPLSADRRDELRAEARGLDMQRTQRDWRPGR